MKLGSNGSAYISKLKEIKMKTVTELNPSILKEYKIIDTTGAGDCFTAAFSVRYIEIFSLISFILFILILFKRIQTKKFQLRLKAKMKIS